MALHSLAVTIQILPGHSEAHTSTPDSVTTEIAKQRIDGMSDHQVHRPEIGREQENRNDHDGCSSLDFLERGRSHLLHLSAHVVVESLDPLRPRPDGRCQRVLFRNTRHGLFLLSFLPATASAVLAGRLKILAGAEGFEPPS